MQSPQSIIETIRVELSTHPALPPGGRILVAMSGGVDSSVAAALLHHLGYDVVGVSMHLFPKSPEAAGGAGRCCTLDDFQDARRVAWDIGIPHYVKNYEHNFHESVIRPFVESYLQGETPSPCILCNQHLKFGALLQLAREIGTEAVATGHYARITHDAEGFHLRTGADLGKDQSYFLFPMPQDILARCLFPLGGLSKPEVRLLADHFGLHLGQKAESQEICFVGDRHYSDIVAAEAQLPPRPGHILHRDGRVLGRHEGYWHFTVGQRRGLGIAHPVPLYVLSVDPATNQVIVGEEADLGGTRVVVRDLTWCRPAQELEGADLSIKIRSRGPATPCRVQWDGTHLTVEMDAPVRAVAPGQAAVLYRGDEVLAGGWIRRPS